MFWFIFILSGLAIIPLAFLFITNGATITEKIVGAIICFSFWLLLSFGINYGVETNAEAWNNGFCECGTHWELRGVSEYRNSETKYYACPNCYAEIELHY